MSDAQTCTTIGGMFTFMLAFMAILVRLFGQNLDARFGALTAVMTAGFERIDRRFEQVERRLDRIEDRVDALDRDVTAITRRLMDGPDTP
jgi:hypothetical protein